MRLKGRVAVVTGGGRGIGAVICRELSAEGALVAVTDQNSERSRATAKRISSSGGRAAAWTLDVTIPAQVESVADSVEQELGAIDIWVNNAGVSFITPFLQCTDELWTKTIQVNLTGTFNGCRAALRRMAVRGSGAIINMSSQSGKIGTSQYAAYCSSKFGVIGLTQSLAAEFARQGIRINAICPGIVFTPMWESMVEDYAKKAGIAGKEVKPYLEQKIPMGRIGTAEEVARLAVFLAGDEACYITGQSINVSGGTVMH
ncbi:MAG TPA: SDR family NAD(P)-dependent oxidoreductase [Spirochaetia bacterium]|nr:SDR family NAD(P)-dependent oxidoreductase [Spirochaetia bacterium]